MKNSGFTCVPRDIDRNACGYSEMIITWLQSHLKYPNSQYGNRYGTRQIYFGGVTTRTIDDVTDHKIGRRKKRYLAVASMLGEQPHLVDFLCSKYVLNRQDHQNLINTCVNENSVIFSS